MRTVISVSPGEVLTVHTGRAVFGAGQATTVSASDSTVLVDAPGGSGREYVNSTDSFPTVQPSDTLVAGTSTLTLGQQPPYGSLLPSVFAAGGVPFVNSQAPSAPFVYGSRFVPHVTGSGFYTQWLGGNGEADLQW